MSVNPAKRPINLGKSGAAQRGVSSKPGMSAGRKSTLAIGLIAAGGMSIFAFTPREQCEVDPATGQQQCSSSRSSSGGSSHGGSSSSRSWGFGSSGSDSGSGHSTIARGGFGSSGGFHFSGGG
ncbi:hypothetical protein [Methylocella sp. CPCC 101449]|uniref:hypothetical protein n=1 Tax=Methylocella sp. CPCC 101449 TaxID=2987531 RepID=UPI0028905136|nr:hypothetical protein [Methylocella sp. CPCC 101449]MDT2023844.1 hypothetical protein [Methylocella sp. CPCC 101449]